ncbi:MAG: ABC transporter ATP-binding protein [Planctomycetota bacterium]
MPLLEIHGLQKSFAAPDGSVLPVLSIAHFELGEKRQVALEGRSGSGKTTFLHCIAGISKPDGGRIVIQGQDVSRLSESGRDAFRAQNIGYVFQTFNLLQGYTALENVLLGMYFGPGPDPDRATSLLERLGLGDRLGFRPSQLSIGQQQRVAVARALANHPKLVLADEPTGNLDAGHAAEALDLMRSICREQEAALLLVSHDPAVLAQFDERLSLSKINAAVGGVST